MMKKTYNHILVWGVIFYSICIVYFALLLKNILPWGWKLQVFSILDAWFFF